MDRALAKARARSREPEARAKYLASRPAAGRKRSETALAWCPAQYREDYRILTRSKAMSAAEAKAFILARLTPFERALHAVSRGAGIVIAQPLRRRDPDFTLGGVANW